MADFNLVSDFKPAGDQAQAIEALVNGIKNKDKHQTLLGITGSGKTFTMANVIQEVQKPTLIISHNKTLAAQLFGEFKALFPDNAVELFISYYDYYQPEAYMPVSDTFIEKDSSIDEEIDKLRIKSTASLSSRKDVIIIASVSCIYGIGSPSSYKDLFVFIKKGDILDIKSFFKKLVNIHYNRNDMVLEPGTFRLRGDVIEIFPRYEDYPIRIELFGDEVDRIYSFDPLKFSVLNEQDSVSIFPAKHFVVTRQILEQAMEKIRVELGERLMHFKENGMLLEAQRLEQRTLFDLEMMMELGYCSGIENYSRHIDGRRKGQRPFTLLDFFSDDFLIFADESHVSIPQLNAMYNGDRSRKETLIEYGFRLPSAIDNRPMKFSEFEETVNQIIYVSATPSNYELEKSKGVYIEQIIRPTGLLDPNIILKPTEGQIDDIIKNINDVVSRKEKILITTLTKKMAEKLTDYLKGVGIRAEYMHSDIDTIERIKILTALRNDEFDVLVGINLLREGLDLPEVSLIVVIDADKEGFLRSKTSLLQVAGRAARNINGTVILYADKITKSMQHLIDETKRRRKIQKDFNKKHNIIPQTIKKKNRDLLTSMMVRDNQKIDSKFKLDELDCKIEDLDNIEILDLIEKSKRKMKKHAQNFQFEEAALLRDQIIKLNEKIKK
jgi:excinuclease ABC subunit B